MKKVTVSMATALLLLTFSLAQLKAGTATGPTSTASTGSAESAEAAALITRLDEINAMDKSKLSSPDRKQLRREVRTIKKHLSDLGGGVYISVAAVVIIILLLVILL